MNNNLGEPTGRFPKSSDELEEWQAAGYTFSQGSWYLPQAPQTEPQVSPQVSEAMETSIADITAGVGSLTQEIDTAQAPPINTGADDAVAAGNGDISSFQDYLDQIQKDYEDSLTQIEKDKETTDTGKGILGFFKDQADKRDDIKDKQKTSQELYEETLATYGLTPESVTKVKGLIGQLTTYNTQIAALEAQKQAALDKVEARAGIDIGFMGREQYQVSKRYNSEISAKAAQASIVSQQIQMEQGMWDEARATAGKIVDLALYDQKQELADLEWAQDTYIDLYKIMKAEEKEMWDRKYTLAKDKLDESKDRLNNVMNLMLEYSGAGITIEDTVAEATKKAMDWDKEQPAETTGYAPTAGMKDYDLAVSQGYTGSYAEWMGKEAESVVEEIDWNEETITALKEQGINDDEILAAAKADGREEEVRAMLEKEYSEGVMDTGGVIGKMSDTAYSLWKKAKSWLK